MSEIRQPWYVRYGRPFAALLGSVILLTLAFAPVGQFYLAWVGLVPWLWVVYYSKSQKAAFFWSWLGGTLFFSANMWWMANISGPGMIALMVYCGIFWGFAGLVIRGVGILDWQRPIAAILSIAAVWTACEWLRGNLMTGLPWLFLGHTQSPLLVMCQIADIAGAYGVSFWVMMFNALVLLAWLNRRQINRLFPAAIFAGVMIGAIAAYGQFRLGESKSLVNGPVIAVVQPNYPQSNDGSKGASNEDRLAFHLQQTEAALRGHSQPVDMAVWSETMMPPINRETLQLPVADSQQDLYREIDRRISGVCEKNNLAILTGGEYEARWTPEIRNGEHVLAPLDRRNTAYFFNRRGLMIDSPGERYDKIHLVPFGEFIPFKHTLPFLYRLFVRLGPEYYTDYELQSGADDALTVFHLSSPSGEGWRFVTPICFEDIDSRICATMLRPKDGGNRKRADFLVNITNDGWFKANENAQHLQAAIFRSIENRVPTARSVNTGISGFIDSTGHTENLLAARISGTSVMQLKLDPRLTIFTQWGDVFADACLFVTGILAAIGLFRKSGKR